MTSRFTIVGLGEALFDVLPGGEVLGGAPLNVAVHAQQLARPHGGNAALVSRVGQDDLGKRVIEELNARGVDASAMQSDPDLPTGRVYVSLDDRGQPQYEIVPNVAWDAIQFDPDAEQLARRCAAVCFGTLAQRNGQSRSSIQRFVSEATRAVRLLDVNLRQSFYDARLLTRCCELAHWIKLNEQELPIVARLVNEPAEPAAILRRFKLQGMVYTRGAQGTQLITPTQTVQSAQVPVYPPQPQADPVGAGDACAAAVLVGLVQRWPLQRIVELADRVGAFVASVPGATPSLPAL